MIAGCRIVAAALAAVVVGPSAAHCSGAPRTEPERAVAHADRGGTAWSRAGLTDGPGGGDVARARSHTIDR